MSLPFLRTPRQLLSHSSPSTHLSCCFSLVRTPPPSLLRPHSLAPRAPPPLPSWSFRPFLVSTRVSQHARPARRFRNLRNAGKRGCSRGEFAYRPCSYMFVLNRLCVRQSQCGVSRCSNNAPLLFFFFHFSAYLLCRSPCPRFSFEPRSKNLLTGAPCA